ncbi:MAG: NADH-quinone oxidoreductase subunit J [Elusimicrobia bacterium]|nr:NADH-quinone oxidoreductase subunit J [Elusimicrobiota bacterium]
MNFALAAVGSGAALFAILTVFQRNLYASALCLMAVLLQVAALFFLLGAQVLGFLQILVYAGAIMVLIVIAVMSSPARITHLWADFRLPKWLIALVLAVPFGELILASRLGAGTPAFHSVTPALERGMAIVLFGRYALLTEIVGVAILLSALAMIQDNE